MLVLTCEVIPCFRHMKPRATHQCLANVGLCLMFIALAACKHGKCEDGGSSVLSRTSHNVGRDCRSCHHPDGEGEVCWNIGGTVYSANGSEPSAGAQFRLFTKPLGRGDLKLQLQGDAIGNIYTSEQITFGSGLFPAIINAAGDTAFMTEPIVDGACNRCHGNTTERIKLP